MTEPFRIDRLLANEDETRQLAMDLAMAVQPHDIVTLEGDLGSGKSTLARALIRAIAEDDRLEVPSGSHIRIEYEEGRPPILAARIQELFGLAETPRLGGGRVKGLLHLLAPNHRPQQVTDDLASFWANGYPVVRKELRGRYPKHAWPEDPLTAEAIRGPKKR